MVCRFRGCAATRERLQGARASPRVGSERTVRCRICGAVDGEVECPRGARVRRLVPARLSVLALAACSWSDSRKLLDQGAIRATVGAEVRDLSVVTLHTLSPAYLTSSSAPVAPSLSSERGHQRKAVKLRPVRVMYASQLVAVVGGTRGLA